MSDVSMCCLVYHCIIAVVITLLSNGIGLDQCSCVIQFMQPVHMSQLTKLQNAQYAKDGQIKILRDKYSQAQAELSLQKQQALKTIEQQTEEKTRKEADLERDVDRLRSQLKFKEHELTELHGGCFYVSAYYCKDERLAVCMRVIP